MAVLPANNSALNAQVNQQVEKTTKFRWVILAIMFVVYTVAMADRANIGVSLPFIRKDFPMSNTEAGTLVSLMFAGYALMQIPAGFLIKRFGAHSVFTWSMVFTSLTTGLIGFSSTILQLKFLRMGLGMAEGPIGTCLPTIVNNWFPKKEKGFATGIYLSAGKFGPLIVPPICALIIQTWSWHEIFLIFAVPGFFLAAVWHFAGSSHPDESKYCSPAEVKLIHSDTASVSVQEKQTKSNKFAWLDRFIRARKVERIDDTVKIFTSWDIIGCALGFLVIVALTGIMMTWIPTYLITVKKFTTMKMAFAAASPFAGTILGNLGGGWLSDNVFGGRRKPLIMVSSLATAISMYCLIYSPEDPWLLGASLFVTGFFLTLGLPCFIAYGMGRVSKDKYPLFQAINNTFGQIGAFIAPIIVGILLDKYNWDAVFTTLAISCVFCFLVVSTIVEPVDE